MTSPARLRGGIVGCGFFAQNHLDAWRRMPEVELAAAADPDLDRAAKAAPHAYSSAEEMLDRERLDFIDIATRPELHLPLVRLAAHRRLAVICQKPMAPSWQECVEMVETAESAGVRLMMHENWRWQAWFRKAKEAIEKGAIGRPIAYNLRMRHRDGLGSAPYPQQPYARVMPRFIIHEALVHHLDTARFLFGELATVYARIRRLNPVMAGEDQAVLLLTHQSGLIGTVDGHRFSNPEPDGPAVGDSWIEGEDEVLRIPGTGDVLIGRDTWWRMDLTTGYRGESVKSTQEHFIRCLRDGSPFETGAREYLKTVRAVDAAYESAGSGAAVSL